MSDEVAIRSCDTWIHADRYSIEDAVLSRSWKSGLMIEGSVAGREVLYAISGCRDLGGPTVAYKIVEVPRSASDESDAGLSTPEPDPTPNASTPIWDLVIEDMRQRDHEGRRKYGIPLQAGNGRDPLVDAYQEALDLCVYLRQAIEEKREARARDRRSGLAEWAGFATWPECEAAAYETPPADAGPEVIEKRRRARVAVQRLESEP